MSVINPSAKSHSAGAARHIGNAAEKRERQKTRRHQAVVAAEKALFLPAVIETYGHFGSKLQALIKRIATAGWDNLQIPPGPFTKQIVLELAIALQRGNAMAVMQGMGMARSAEARRQQRAFYAHRKGY